MLSVATYSKSIKETMKNNKRVSLLIRQNYRVSLRRPQVSLCHFLKRHSIKQPLVSVNILVLIQWSPWMSQATVREYLAKIFLQPKAANHTVDTTNVPMAFSPHLHHKFHMP